MQRCDWSVKLSEYGLQQPKITDTYIPEFLKTGLAKIRAHFTTGQLKAIKSVQRPIKMHISDAEQ